MVKKVAVSSFWSNKVIKIVTPELSLLHLTLPIYGERDSMKQRWLVSLVVFLLLGAGFAQQQATLSGLAKVKNAEGVEETPANTKVAIHIVDRDNAWIREIASSTTTAGTFSIQTAAVNADELTPFRNGAVLLPGLQNEYTVAPEGANFAKGQINMYVDTGGNNIFDRDADSPFIGVASLENPIGFFSLVYVDQNVTISGKGATLELATGWNVFTVRYPDGGEPVYAVQPTVQDVLMDVFLP
jgi:hypothetical protein